MKRIAIVLLALTAAAAANSASPSREDSLAAAEREFAAAGLRDGVQRSFLAHFADDAVVLKPFAVPAADWYRAHPDRPGSRLIWGPQYVAVAAAGDLGLSSGPWRAEAEKDGKPVRAHGHFFSIWRRNGEGRWKVLFDHGVVHAEPAVAVEATALSPLAVAAPKPSGADARRSALVAADDALRERLRADRPAAYAALTRDDTLWLRDGMLPVQSAAAPAQAAKGPCGCGPRVALGVARSGDLAYTIGGAESARERGADARIWRFDVGRGWMLLADLAVAAD